ncbi:MAG: hypothetical protein QOI43_718 [Gaiellales bacterium]|nr:hypothetical protein [Gaiellales bacterium]
MATRIAKSVLPRLAADRKMNDGANGKFDESPPPFAAIMNWLPTECRMIAPKIATTISPPTPARAMLFAVLSVLAWRSSPPTNEDQ